MDVSHLIGVFKSRHGTTPEVWRRVWGKPTPGGNTTETDKV